LFRSKIRYSNSNKQNINRLLYAANDVLAVVNRTFEENDKAQWVSGKIRLKRGGEWVEVGKPFSASKVYRGMRSVSHPTWFVKNEI